MNGRSEPDDLLEADRKYTPDRVAKPSPAFRQERGCILFISRSV
ncbi:MAG: hypothetical protein O3A19_08245 [Planctomycetota bacterium]|nr:hypothetical protein [Planctomycetota bacterium]MDA1026401.1 hypothetical protein [Planctomycetota bacterium]